MDINILKATAQALLARNKGILAADESAPTCAKRFDALGIPCTEETRRAYRELLFTAPEVEHYLSGVILFDETIRQSTSAGVPFPKALSERGIVPGIKVDMGAKDLALHAGEKVTEGLDGLRERLAEYKAFGARFAKWRAVIAIGANTPSEACYVANAHALARYAALCQEADIVPIIEPEVLLDGDHTIERCFEVAKKTLQETFAALKEQDVHNEGVILKTSMVLSGKAAAVQADNATIAQKTLQCFTESVPENLAGIVFLSGGQPDEPATARLNEVSKINTTPWRITFSYSRGIQSPVLKLWAEKQNDRAMQAYVFRAKANALASEGKYEETSEKDRPY